MYVKSYQSVQVFFSFNVQCEQQAPTDAPNCNYEPGSGLCPSIQGSCHKQEGSKGRVPGDGGLCCEACTRTGAEGGPHLCLVLVF